MRIAALYVCLFLSISSFTSEKRDGAAVQWTENLPGDFSFSKKQSVSCEAWCYEWAGTKSISCKAVTADSVICETAMNAATHCSLHLSIAGDNCLPVVYLKSITRNGDKIYPYKTGYIRIDRRLWRRKIMKAEFSFEFRNDENDKLIFWKGKIYSPIR